MASPASIHRGELSSSNIVKNESSKGKTIAFAILIILGFGGLAVAGVGLGGYLQAGSLSSIGQMNSMIMMASGICGGIVFLIVGIVGSVKNCQQIDSNKDSELKRNVKTVSGSPTHITEFIDTQNGLFYGPKAYKKWNVEVVDKVPKAPTVDLSKNDKFLFYIPERIKFNNNTKYFDIHSLKEINPHSFTVLTPNLEKQSWKASGRWVLIDKPVLPEIECNDYEAQKKIIEEKGYKMPSVFEALVVNMLLFDFTDKWLYRKESDYAFICCDEKIGESPICVGVFGSDKTLIIDGGSPDPLCNSFAVCTLQKF